MVVTNTPTPTGSETVGAFLAPVLPRPQRQVVLAARIHQRHHLRHLTAVHLGHRLATAPLVQVLTLLLSLRCLRG